MTVGADGATRRDSANAEAVKRLIGADPVLVDVQPLQQAVPGFDRSTVLTSGAPLEWKEYTGGQRAGIIGGAIFEQLAPEAADAQVKLAAVRIKVRSFGDLGCGCSLVRSCMASLA